MDGEQSQQLSPDAAGALQRDRSSPRVSDGCYRAIVEAFDGLIYICSADLRILYMNDRFIAHAGRDATGEACYRVLHDLDAPCSWCQNDSVFRGETIRWEVQSPRDGHWYDVVNTPLQMDDGSVAKLAMIQDVTERKRAAAELLAEKNKLEALIAGIGAGVTVQDTNFRILYQNAVHRQNQGSHVGELCYRAYRQRDTVCDGCLLVECFRDGKTHRRETSALAGGKAIHMEVTAAPVRDGEGRVVAGVEVVRDITDQKRMEEELVKTQKLESLGLLAGGIAHDFNNLLTGVLGNISLAKLAMDPASEAYELLLDAEQANFRARELTGQLLTFSQGGTPVKSAASIGELVRESAAFILHGSRIGCSVTVADDLWLVEADEGQLNQVFNNLFINAQQAMPEGGTITVDCINVIFEDCGIGRLQAGRYVGITVADEGTGIAPEHLPKIFDPYFTTKEKGTGLGLATSYSIIKRHGGHLAVQSEPGRGTQFTIYLPAACGAGKDEREDNPLPHPGCGRILVMDDEEIVQKMIGKMLDKLGYEGVLCGDGEEAVELFGRAVAEGRPFAAVILDLTVRGGMGGEEVLGLLRRIDSQVRAIVSSGYSDDAVMADSSEHGFAAALVKPYSIEELGETLHCLKTDLRFPQ